MREDLRNRTFEFSLNIIEITELLPKNKTTDVIIYQLVKCGTSVGANYRAAKRARSDKEFISKINIVLEEADETLFWLEIIKAKTWIKNELIEIMKKEADELTAIFVSTLKTMNSKIKI
jgi:four helix bundle protein